MRMVTSIQSLLTLLYSAAPLQCEKEENRIWVLGNKQEKSLWWNPPLQNEELKHAQNVKRLSDPIAAGFQFLSQRSVSPLISQMMIPDLNQSSSSSRACVQSLPGALFTVQQVPNLNEKIDNLPLDCPPDSVIMSSIISLLIIIWFIFVSTIWLIFWKVWDEAASPFLEWTKPDVLILWWSVLELGELASCYKPAVWACGAEKAPLCEISHTGFIQAIKTLKNASILMLCLKGAWILDKVLVNTWNFFLNSSFQSSDWIFCLRVEEIILSNRLKSIG